MKRIAVLCALLCVPAATEAADTPFSTFILTAPTRTIDGTEAIPLVVTGGTKKTTVTNLFRNIPSPLSPSVSTNDLILQAPTPAANSGSIAINGTLRMKQNSVATAGTGFGTGGLSPAAIWEDIAWSGVNDTGAGNFNFLRANDTVDASARSNALALFSMEERYNAGADGSRKGLVLTFSKNAASLTGSSVNTHAFTALQVFGHYDADEGGTPGNYSGSYTVFNPDGRCRGAATGGTCDYISNFRIIEADSRLETGTHADLRKIINAHFGTGDATHGAREDAGITIDASGTILPGTGRGTVAIQLGAINGVWPLDPTLDAATIIGIQPNEVGAATGAVSYAAGYGVDFQRANFGHYAWRSTGFWVDGSGQIDLGPARFSYSANTATLDVDKVVELTAVVVAGGTGSNVGDEYMDTIGGIWSVATISGVNPTGPVTTVALLKPGYAASCPASPTATTGGDGSGLTLNITCSTATKTLSLAPADILAANLTTVAAGTGKHFVCIDSDTGKFYRGTGVSCN